MPDMMLRNIINEISDRASGMTEETRAITRMEPHGASS